MTVSAFLRRPYLGNHFLLTCIICAYNTKTQIHEFKLAVLGTFTFVLEKLAPSACYYLPVLASTNKYVSS
jgi:hypothetical protein